MEPLNKSAASFFTVLKGKRPLYELFELESQEQHLGVLTEALGCISAKKPSDFITEENLQHSWAYLAASVLYLASISCREVCNCSLSKGLQILPGEDMGCCRILFGHPQLPVEMVMDTLANI